MVEALVLEWLEEYNALSESEIRSYAAEQVHNTEIVLSLYNVFDEHLKYSQVSFTFNMFTLFYNIFDLWTSL